MRFALSLFDALVVGPTLLAHDLALSAGDFPRSAAQSREANPRAVMPPFPAVSFQEAINDVLRVGILVVDRREGRDLRSLLFETERDVRERQSAGHRSQKITS